MGWADCGTDRDGRSIGYAHEAVCDWPGCKAEIDRGLSYLCGEMHQDGQSCNGYFCPAHLAYGRGGFQMCLECRAFDLMLRWDDPCADDEHCGECGQCCEATA